MILKKNDNLLANYWGGGAAPPPPHPVPTDLVKQNMGEPKSCGDPEQDIGPYIYDPVADGK